MAENLKVIISGDASGLNTALSSATSKLSVFEDRVNKIADVGSKLSGLGRTLTAGLTLPIVGLGAASVKAYGDIEALKNGLEAVTGSAAEAEAQFNRLKEVAKLPGLGLQEAIKGAINLQAIGIEASKAENILMQFGNAVATVGKGRVEFERAIYGVQQLANTDFPLGEDLNIIKDALPQVNTLLKEAFGSARSDELKAMGVTSREIVDTITEGLSELPRVTGGVKGAFENLSDSLNTELGRIGEIINDNLDISGIVDKLTSSISRVVDVFENLSPTLQNIILGVAGVAAAAGPLLVIVGGFVTALPTIITGVGALGTAFAALTGPIGLVIAGIVGVVTAVVTNWGKIEPYIVGTINYFIDLYNESLAFRGAVQSIAFQFKFLYEAVKTVLGAIWRQIKNLALSIAETFAGVGSVIKGALTFNADEIVQGVSRIGSAVKNGIGDAVDNVGDSFRQLGKDFTDTVKTVTSVSKVSKINDLGLGDALKINMPGLENSVADEVSNGIVNGAKKGAKSAIEKIKSEKVFEFEIPAIIRIQADLLYDNSRRIFEQSADILDHMASYIPTVLAESVSSAEVEVNRLNNTFSQVLNEGVVSGIADAAMAMGDALANGDNALAAVGSSMLSTLGGIMIDLGKIAIKTAVGIKAIKVALKSLNPGVALAAGVALVAFGSLIKGAVSSLGGSSGGLSGGISGGISNTTTGYSGYTPPESKTQSYSNNTTQQEIKLRVEGRDLVGSINATQIRQNRING